MTELDEDGYPTEELLEYVRTKDVKNHQERIDLLDYVLQFWYHGDYGWDKNFRETHKEYANAVGKGITIYHVSTLGWSGNEDLIRALQDNFMFWAFAWYSSRRGGHYKFLIEHLTFKDDQPS